MMNDFKKTAYEAGVAQAFIDANLVKTAGPVMDVAKAKAENAMWRTGGALSGGALGAGLGALIAAALVGTEDTSGIPHALMGLAGAGLGGALGNSWGREALSAKRRGAATHEHAQGRMLQAQEGMAEDVRSMAPYPNENSTKQAEYDYGKLLESPELMAMAGAGLGGGLGGLGGYAVGHAGAGAVGGAGLGGLAGYLGSRYARGDFDPSAEKQETIYKMLVPPPGQTPETMPESGVDMRWLETQAKEVQRAYLDELARRGEGGL